MELHNKFCKSALQLAMETRNMDIINLLLSHKNIDINAPFQEGFSALYFAVQSNDIEMVKLLLENTNTDINQISISRPYFNEIFFEIKYNLNFYILMKKL